MVNAIDKMQGPAVYVMSCSASPYCKVGYSMSPGARAATLSTGGVGQYRIEWAARFPDGGASTVEKDVNRALKRQGWHAKREWFSCSPEHAAREVSASAARLGFAMTPDLNFGVDRTEGYRGREAKDGR